MGYVVRKVEVMQSARLRWRTRIIGFVALGLAASFHQLAGGDRLGEWLFDFYQRAFPRVVETYPARVVEIDSESLRRFGTWPWSRFLLADLAEEAFARGALVIGFDMLFQERGRDSPGNLVEKHPELSGGTRRELETLPDPDLTFAKTIARLPVVLGRAAVAEAADAGPRAADRLDIHAEFDGDPGPGGLRSFPGAVANIPELDRAAAGQGLINGAPDSDGVVRKVPLVATVGGRPMPSFAMELIRVAIDVDGYALSSEADRLSSISVGDLVVPTEGDGRIRLHFTTPNLERTVSAVDLLDGKLEPEAFRGMVVLVAATAVGLQDIVATPLASESYGIDVHAQAIENLLTQAWLIRPSWALAMEWALAIALAALVITFLPRCPPAPAIVCTLGAILSLFAVSMLAFAEARLLLDPVLPSLVAGPPALATLGAVRVELDRSRRALELEALLIERDMAVAGDIQLGMLPSDTELRNLPPEVDLGVRLAQARAVGGDLYDVFMLDAQRLFFLVGDVAGKGVPAALFMSLSKALTKSAALHENHGLDSVVTRANREISRENPSELFVAGVFGVLDLQTGEVELCNAGHEDPVLKKADGSCLELTMIGGPPLCVVDDYAYPIESVSLAPGDLILIATDGASEAQAPDGRLFGRRRILETLKPLPVPVTASAAVTAVTAAVEAFQAGGSPSDDLTVIALRYCGPGRHVARSSSGP